MPKKKAKEGDQIEISMGQGEKLIIDVHKSSVTVSTTTNVLAMVAHSMNRFEVGVTAYQRPGEVYDA